MNILNESTFIDAKRISMIENAYNAKYVFESCLKTKFGDWGNFPVAIFYTEKAHPKGSNYFGIYMDENGDFMITNAITAMESFDGLQVGNDVIYSRYRHDYREYKGAMVDGGRDYFKRSTDRGTPVRLHVVGDHLEVIDDRVSN